MIEGSWFTAWANAKKNSGIAFTICTNQFHLPRKECKGLKLVSKIALKKWNPYTNFFLDHSVRKKKTGLSFQMSRCSAGMTQKVEFHLLSNRIFRKLFVKGKQPYKLSPLTSNFNLHGLASKFSFGGSSV